jgi:hypothetical protein
VTPKAPLAPKYNGMPDDAVAPEEVMATSPEPSRAPPFDPDSPPKAAPPPGAPYMPGHAEFLSARDTAQRDDDMVRRQEVARRQGRPGGQVPLSEMKPDPRPQQEFVNFTLAGNGRIKRC